MLRVERPLIYGGGEGFARKNEAGSGFGLEPCALSLEGFAKKMRPALGAGLICLSFWVQRRGFGRRDALELGGTTGLQ